MVRENILTEQDLAIVRSFILPIQQNIPLADNPKHVTTVLLMLACGMSEHVHFGTKMVEDATFESDELGYGMKLFQDISAEGDILHAAISYVHYLNTGETRDFHEIIGQSKSTIKKPAKQSIWVRFVGFMERLMIR